MFPFCELKKKTQVFQDYHTLLYFTFCVGQNYTCLLCTFTITFVFCLCFPFCSLQNCNVLCFVYSQLQWLVAFFCFSVFLIFSILCCAELHVCVLYIHNSIFVFLFSILCCTELQSFVLCLFVLGCLYFGIVKFFSIRFCLLYTLCTCSVINLVFQDCCHIQSILSKCF